MHLLFLIFLATPAFADEWIRVRLSAETIPQFKIEGQIHRLQGFEKVYQEVSIPKNQQLTLKFDERWIAEDFKKFPIVFKEKNLVIEGRNLFVNGKRVPDKILFSPDKNQINVIGVLPLEQYVVGVLAHEMPSHWPLETLKAQAIAARSYALAVKKSRWAKSFHLESSVLDQVYGALSESELQKRYGKVLEAVKQTTGQVLLDTKKKVLKAYYHADCGGQTVSAQEAWNTKEDLVAVKDEFCPQNPRAQWELNLNEKHVKQKLKSWAPPGSVQIVSLKALPGVGSDRVAQVEVEWEKGLKTSVPALAFRQIFGFFEFKSTKFQVTQNGTDWKFQGQGFGHGVGLCQWGSRHLGKKGWAAQNILRHYYPKADLSRL